MPAPDNLRRLVAGAVIAVGVLVLGLSGTCTALAVRSALNMIPVALVFGGPFLALGLFTLLAGFRWIGGAERVSWAPALGVIYMLAGALALLLGVAMLGSGGVMALWAFGAAAGFLGVGWRMTKMN